MRQRWNRRATIELVCWLLVAVIALFLVIGLVDFAIRPVDRGIRVLLSLVFVLGLAAVAVRLARWWQRRQWSDLSAAQHLQQAFPQLGDRLASALEFLRQEEDDPTAGSAPMRRAVVADATALLEMVSTKQVLDNPTHRRALTVVCSAGVVALAIAVLAPASTQTSLARLLAPWNNLEWPRQHNLEFSDPPTLLARGEAFEVALIDTSGHLPEEVAIEYRYHDDDRWRTEQTWMQQVGDAMVARRENVRRDFEFRAMGGDHHSMPWTKVEVVDPPSVTDLQVTVHPPAYSGLSPLPLGRGNRVLSGSQLELSAMATEPLATAELVGAFPEPLAISVAKSSDPKQPVDPKLSIPPEAWKVAVESGSQLLRPNLHLKSSRGLTGEVELPSLEVVMDNPPEVRWLSSAAELFVVPDAVVPVRLEASDNLALSEVHLELRAPGMAETGGMPATIELYNAGATPPIRPSLPPAGETLEQRSLTTELQVSAWQLEVGSVVELHGVASDYRPQSTRTNVAYRLTLITPAELQSRLAGDQAEILRLLEQALAEQRASQEQASRVASQLEPSRQTLDELLAARLSQQAVGRTLLEPEAGVVAAIQHLLEQLQINRQAQPELVQQLQGIVQTVVDLGQTTLPAAEQTLTTARKQLETQLGQSLSDASRQQLATTFGQLNQEQQSVIDTLESLIDRANAWSDAERFIRELLRLEQQQRDARQASLDAVRQNLQAATDRSIEPVAKAEYARLSNQQSELGRRFEKVVQSMRQMAEGQSVSDDFASRLSNALAAADGQCISAMLSAASQELFSEQVGRAAETQLSAADALRELIDRLRDHTPTDPAELAARLRQMQKQLAATKQQASSAQNDDEERKLADDLQNLSRELNRMTAEQASQSTQQASSTAGPRRGETPEQQKERMQQTRRKIEQAERELGQRIAELEGEQQQKILDQLAEVLDELIPSQQQALEQTVALQVFRESTGRFDDGATKRIAELSKRETDLADQLDQAMTDVKNKPIFQLALGGAADDMRQASTALADKQTGRPTQNLELAALTRMRHVLEILREPPPAPPEEEQDDSDGGGGGEGGGNQPQRPPLIELAEVKMLRWLQADLNGRTRMFEADVTDNVSDSQVKREAANRLSNEQNELARLVRELLERNNKAANRPVDL
ncbi:coiled-coil domain-containing protein [Aeoliella mucimassa]|uniref:Uncharacterized protein n=1 Tax=Aeoliella mucimassa TaxID=2527972 RepID=A0A518AJU8_9BACT|nr:hypothetical protein [Aeoliella mucimassa]QDU55003.1 hypothetical protein Pan181_11880 [Aeoliella mucimassa]